MRTAHQKLNPRNNEVKRLFFTALILSASAFGQAPISAFSSYREPATRLDARPPAYWKVSLAPVIAAQSLDIASSWGRIENNPLLAGQNGRFGTQGAGIKIGIVGAAVVAEYLILKRHPKMARLFSCLNYANAVFTGSVAVRNYRTR
jgi:hypothetical protein